MTLHGYLTEAKYESLRTLRMPAFVAPFSLVPVALYLFFGVLLYGAVKDRTIAASIFTAFAAFAVMGPGMFAFGIFIATEREQGLLTLRRAFPAPPATYLLAKMTMAVLFAAVISIIMIVTAMAVGRFSSSMPQWLAFLAIMTLGSLPFCSMGLLIGSLSGAKAAPAFVNLLYLPMIYLSGMIPLPQSLRWIEFGSPVFYLDQLAHRALNVPASCSIATAILFLAAVTLLPGLLATKRLVHN